ncbi:N-acetyltransferase [Mesorhizobium sp. M7A.F.Ca.US.006.04.2.1]|uniref:GNAT family N-acetyltransferase n=2 Tax=Mesorhizobium TaxID=68287 RepID=UPI000FCAFA18|nr:MULTISPECIES: GNAT family N-acetyltransferase [unclassified Mesorhizobium]MBZ9890696.1 GNAT family N-acetyltransferase [Mesorhizobium sp. BR1-1-3]RUX71122.1 N-acetyltransferase [Mesorhizobium sp. M7A.F.Ca.US.005.03.1.1]RUY15883.1 N-acetyltransferase [Mesorhizobium sp. M7A.F.Ca.US.005.03.2.1]RUY28466.1 N-acetyltransferase [Mesorhizobium sp. M7A.F.Ca.US.001.04.2.1]RUY42767.1 N-acetyltransferase [Mesorhizobium sp. M7A.F.Ca.US.001.04.1.1]
MTLSVPVPLADHHELGEFSSGITALDDWLKKRARTNQAGGASRTYVTCKGNRVIGYYAVASGAVKMVEASSRFRRDMPDPIPVAVQGRLAVDQAYHGRGIGRALVRDAGLRILQAAEILGIKGIVVHAISDDARAFYITIGFEPSPVEPLTLMVTLADLSESIG